mmetsp:Transcript_105216/g.302557  ORF Transcript_105216/g.302557 Transcript_105216/m.302557 type:complete len:335 (-) Transcript_105216:8-1012(-)
MLHHCEDSLRLHALHVCLRQRGSEHGVVPREVLKVPAVPGDTVNVDGGPEDGIRALGAELLAQSLSELVDDAVVPSGGHGQQRWEDRDAADGFAPHGAEATRGVLHVEGWEVQARDCDGVTDVPKLAQVEPLAQRMLPTHAAEEGILLALGHLPQGEGLHGGFVALAALHTPLVGAQRRLILRGAKDYPRLLPTLAVQVEVARSALPRLHLRQNPARLGGLLTVAIGLVVEVIAAGAVVGRTVTQLALGLEEHAVREDLPLAEAGNLEQGHRHLLQCGLRLLVGLVPRQGLERCRRARGKQRCAERAPAGRRRHRHGRGDRRGGLRRGALQPPA